MASNPIMTPAQDDCINKPQVTEQKLRQEVRYWFNREKVATYTTINETLINHPDTNKNYAFCVDIKTYDLPGGDKIYDSNKLSSTLTRDETYSIIRDETQKQCSLVGAFIKAKGHNLTNVDYRICEPYAYGTINDTEISCNFTIGSTEKNTKK